MLFKKKCYLCNRKTKEVRKYYNDKHEKIHVCTLCLEYAERRAYRKA